MSALDLSRTEAPVAPWGWPWTWQKIRTYMQDKYGGTYSTHELRAMEIKWRKIFAQAGWSVKGQ